MPQAPAAIGFFERYLTVWVALCIMAGVLLGQVLPGAFQTIAALEVAQVNLPVGLLIWVMQGRSVLHAVAGGAERWPRWSAC